MKVFTDKKWIDETIDLINDDKIQKHSPLDDGDDENLKLIEKLKQQLEEAQNKIKELESEKNKSKVKFVEPKQKELTDEDLELELSLLTK